MLPKIKRYILLFVLAIVIGASAILSVFFNFGKGGKNYSQETSSGANLPTGSPEEVSSPSRVSTEGSVQIEVTPQNIASASESWAFSVSLNTHSYDLTEDLILAVELRDESGTTHKPI